MNRALVICALLLNAAVFALFAVDGFASAGYGLVYCGLPVAVLALRRRARTFRVAAGLLGALYAVWGVWGFWFGGWLVVPSAALLLWAAVVPWVDPEHPWRRRAWGAVAVFTALLLTPLATLWFWVLMLR